MKIKVPQFELPTVGSEVFNLVIEEALDGERLQLETQAAAQIQHELKELEQQQQNSLL